MSNHTPGPWTMIGLAADWIGIHTPDGTTLARVDRDGAEIALANARLIAAAPELLEALDGVYQLVINHFPVVGVPPPHAVPEVERARLALAKAAEKRKE